MSEANERLLPPAPRPQGLYVPWAREGALVMTAGMTPRDSTGTLVVTGLVGTEVSVEDARAAAAVAAANALAAVADAVGGMENIERCLRMSVYVACVEGFVDLSTVADAASRELAAHLGPGRLPARSAIGVQSLPGGAPVEIELTAAARC